LCAVVLCDIVYACAHEWSLSVVVECVLQTRI